MAGIPVPDFGSLAGQQHTADTAATNQTNLANRPNQYNPLGSTTWAMNPDGTWSNSTNLSGAAQGLFDASLTGQQNLTNQLGQGINYSSLGAMPQVGQYNQQVIDTWNALQAPGLAQGEQAARNRMAAMGGATVGSSPWATQERAFGNIRTDAGNKAILEGYKQGNTEFEQALKARSQGAGELEHGYEAARTGSAALGDIRAGLNPNKWNPTTPNSAAYLPQSIYGAAQDTFNAQQMNRNASIAEKEANQNAMINLLRTAGGGQGIQGILSGAKSAGGDISGAWNWFSNSPWNKLGEGANTGDPSQDVLGDFINSGNYAPSNFNWAEDLNW